MQWLATPYTSTRLTRRLQGQGESRCGGKEAAEKGKKARKAAKKAKKAKKAEKTEKTEKAKVDPDAEKNAEKECAVIAKVHAKDEKSTNLGLRLQLAAFYCKFNPSKLGDVNKLAAHYQDKQMKLNEKLMSQYGKDLSHL